MANVKFSKKQIRTILNDDFKDDFILLKKKMRSFKVYFRSGAECKSVDKLINYFQEHEGNYFSLDAEIKREMKCLLDRK